MSEGLVPRELRTEIFETLSRNATDAIDEALAAAQTRAVVAVIEAHTQPVGWVWTIAGRYGFSDVESVADEYRDVAGLDVPPVFRFLPESETPEGEQ